MQTKIILIYIIKKMLMPKFLIPKNTVWLLTNGYFYDNFLVNINIDFLLSNGRLEKVITIFERG